MLLVSASAYGHGIPIASARRRSSDSIARAFRRLLVIVPQHVEEAVDQQAVDLALQRRVVLGGLPARGVDRDHDVAEQTSVRG